MKIRAVIFDFDGVICESVEVKTAAFRRLFESYPQHLDRIVDFHVGNGGISRFKKFDVIYRDILKKTLSKQESEELGRRFSDYCYEAVIKAPLVKGAQEFLEQYYKKLLLFIASGTPQEEMVLIIKEKKLGKFFKGVYGTPPTKTEIIAGILRNYQIKSDEVVFVGDSINDYEGAKEAGVKFVAKINREFPDPFLDVDVNDFVGNISQFNELIRSNILDR